MPRVYWTELEEGEVVRLAAMQMIANPKLPMKKAVQESQTCLPTHRQRPKDSLATSIYFGPGGVKETSISEKVKKEIARQKANQEAQAKKLTETKVIPPAPRPAPVANIPSSAIKEDQPFHAETVVPHMAVIAYKNLENNCRTLVNGIVNGMLRPMLEAQMMDMLREVVPGLPAQVGAELGLVKDLKKAAMNGTTSVGMEMKTEGGETVVQPLQMLNSSNGLDISHFVKPKVVLIGDTSDHNYFLRSKANLEEQFEFVTVTKLSEVAEVKDAKFVVQSGSAGETLKMAVKNMAPKTTQFFIGQASAIVNTRLNQEAEKMGLFPSPGSK